MKKRKSNRLAISDQRVFERERARAGEAVLSFSTLPGESTPPVKHDDLPPGKFVFVDDFVSALKTHSTLMQGIHPNMPTATVLERRLASQAILSIAVLNAPVTVLPGLPSAAIQVEQRERKLIAAAEELRSLNHQMVEQRMSIEDFDVALKKLDFPQEVGTLIAATEKGATFDLVSKHGSIALGNLKRDMKHLPSSRVHRFTTRVMAVTDSASGYCTVSLLEPKVLEPNDSVLIGYLHLSAPVLDRKLRKELLLAQMEDQVVEICARLNSVPLARSAGTRLEVEIQECVVLSPEIV